MEQDNTIETRCPIRCYERTGVLYWTTRDNSYLVPPELAGIDNLINLHLSENALSGPIPPTLGTLPSITSVVLSGNSLTGPIPPELGSLSTLEELVFDNNDLTGSVPPDFGRMASLQELSLTNNAAMSGALPATLTALRQLEGLLADGTDLCTPSDWSCPAFTDG
ncbi:hypothetical protein [Candidatus Palauibacter sp.]|uniref:hypothetical protein n=1 Tax=Candidatus Palauibacter sp. TaxID=3101350 RepID=UPI003B51F233